MDYPILSDPDGKVAAAYGIFTQRGFSSRVTFIIDKEGKIAEIIKKVSTGTHGKQLVEKLQELEVEKN